MSAIAGVMPIVRTSAASSSNQERIGIVVVMRSFRASHASSNQEMAETASSSA